MTVPEANGTTPEAAAAASKPKRVRTGCLTCRERHLKCDEGTPNCQNCRKSNRVCKRGLRLNFIDTQVQPPPHIAPSQEWKIDFMDESREIASEYQGGIEKYGGRERESRTSIAQPMHHRPSDANMGGYDYTAQAPPPPTMSYQALPSIQPMMPEPYPEESRQVMKYDAPSHDPYAAAPNSTHESPYSNSHNMARGSISTYSQADQDLDMNDGKREFLTTQEETLFMQVFVEEVGLWMDSMDPMKHVCLAMFDLRETFANATSSLACYPFILCKSPCC